MELQTSLISGALFQPLMIKLGVGVLQRVETAVGMLGICAYKLKMIWSCRKMGWRRGILLSSFQAPPKGGILRQGDEIVVLFILRLELESL